jgi:hypothetical protein
MNLKRCYFLAFLSALLLGSEVVAQAPHTVWHALGIPQAYKHITDTTLNRKGKHPGLEKKPPLKKLADPANLKSDIPAIKKAAEIKEQEDLAPQKIKAIKYLGQTGCGCYGGVAEALTAALEDCTEEVRYAAALAIVQSLSTNCQICKKTCCTKALAAKMHERAFEQDAEGCFIEPSDRVRAVLQEALNDCPPDMRDVGPIVIPPDTVPPDTVPPPDAPVVPPPDGAAALEEGNDAGAAATSRRGATTSLLHRSSARTPIDGAARIDADALFDAAPEVPMVPRQVTGEVIEGKSRRGYVRIQFDHYLRPAVGTEVDVYHAYVLGVEFAGRLVIAEYDGDYAIAAAHAWESVKVARGDTVKCMVLVPAASAAPPAPAPAESVTPPFPAPEARVASNHRLLLPPPPAPMQRLPIERLPAEPEPVSSPVANSQLDARLLDILQPPPVVVEGDEEATETPVTPVSTETPVKQASAATPVYPVVNQIPSQPIDEPEHLAPIVSPPRVIIKR